MQKQENTTYLKAITIRDPSDLHSIKEDIKKGMVLILRVTPLAQKDVEKLRQVVEELSEGLRADEACIGCLEVVAAGDEDFGRSTIIVADGRSRMVGSKSGCESSRWSRKEGYRHGCERRVQTFWQEGSL